MNPENPLRNEIEARLTALLLGELPENEAALLRWAIAQDSELQKLHDRLQLTVGLVREVAKNPEPTPAETAALKLSAERRAKLLAHFKSPRPAVPPAPTPAPVQELPWLKRIDLSRFQVPRLVEVLAVLAIVAVLAAMLLPSLAASKKKAQKITALNQAKQAELEERMKLEDANSPAPTPVASPPAPAVRPPGGVVQWDGAALGSDRDGDALRHRESGEQNRKLTVASTAPKSEVAPPSDVNFSGSIGNGAAKEAITVSATETARRLENRFYDDNSKLANYEADGKDYRLKVQNQASAGEPAKPAPKEIYEEYRPRVPDASEVASSNFREYTISGNADFSGGRANGGAGGGGGFGRGDVLTTDRLPQAGKAPAEKAKLNVSEPEYVGVLNNPAAPIAPTTPTANDFMYAPRQVVGSAGTSKSLAADPAASGEADGKKRSGGETFAARLNEAINVAAGSSGNVGSTDGREGQAAARRPEVAESPASGPAPAAKPSDEFLTAGLGNNAGVGGVASINGKLENEKMVPLKTDLPQPQFVGTPVPITGFQFATDAEMAQRQKLNQQVTEAERTRSAQKQQYDLAVASYDSKVPVLGDLPLQGQLFKSENRAAGARDENGREKDQFSLNSVTVDLDKPVDANTLSKTGAGTLTLAGTNTYAGGTTVSAGTLGVSGVTTVNGGTLAVNDFTQSFKVDPNRFYSGLTKDDASGLRYLLTTNNVVFESDRQTQMKATVPGGGGLEYMTQVTDASTPRDAVQRLIANLGVDLQNPPGKCVNYIDRLGLLFIRATRQDLDAIEHAFPLQIATNVIANTNANGLISLAFRVSPEKLAKQLDQPLPKQLDQPLPKVALPALVPQPEMLTSANAFSTFSLNVSDVSFKLAAVSLEKGLMPEAGAIRSEEFINAFDYRDPEAQGGAPVAFACERARYPFAMNRDLLRFSLKTAAAGRSAGRPLNLVLLLDNSGSMERADRVAIIRESLRVLAGQLQPQDKISVVTFARTARLWASGIPGDKAGEALAKVSTIPPEGGTNLEEAMRVAYETARKYYQANGMNRVVLLTDGAANLGDVNPADLKQKVETNRKQGIALDCFGIGWEDYNDNLLEQLSSHGDGRYAFLNSPEEVAKEFAAKLAGALQIAAQDVKVQVEFNPQRVISYRQIGYAKHQLTKEQFRDNTVDAAEIAAQEAGNALYTVETKPDGGGPIATVRVRYKVPGTTDYRELSWAVPYNGTAPALQQSSAAMRLAATAGAFSEWLAGSPFAQEVSPDELLKIISGVPQIYGADQRPQRLEWMIRQAKSAAGK